MLLAACRRGRADLADLLTPAGVWRLRTYLSQGENRCLQITGITSNVGVETARAPPGARQPVRAVERAASKGAASAERGCEVALTDIDG